MIKEEILRALETLLARYEFNSLSTQGNILDQADRLLEADTHVPTPIERDGLRYHYISNASPEAYYQWPEGEDHVLIGSDDVIYPAIIGPARPVQSRATLIGLYAAEEYRWFDVDLQPKASP